ncbi:MAG TPA: hypothetical protein VK973_08255, partial [Arenicellales bacterium]|nr:hypothetical protein [Arenicellales bacterium]
MALLWCDGFDHYGSQAAMLDGAYAEVDITGSSGSFFRLENVNARTGTYHLRFIIDTSSGSATIATRRVLGGAKTTVGFGSA